MAEQLKVFKNGIETFSTKDYAYLSNTSTEQKLITDLNFTVTNTSKYIPCQYKLTHGNRDFISYRDLDTLASDELVLEGRELLDNNESINFDITVDTTKYKDNTNYVLKSPIYVFGVYDSIYPNVLDVVGTGLALQEEGTYQYHSELAKMTEYKYDSAVSNAYCAVSRIVNGVQYIWTNHNSSSRIYRYKVNTDNTLTLEENASGLSSTYGFDLDDTGTYIYAKSSSNNTVVYKVDAMNITGNVTTITASSTFAGQERNEGGYTLYYDNHLYTRQYGSSSTAYKVNLTDGTVTTYSCYNNGANTYHQGACIVEATDGKVYIAEITGNYGVRTPLDTLVYDNPVYVGTSNGSTEYSNSAFEISKGFILCFNYSNHENTFYFNVNSNTASYFTSATYNLPRIGYYGAVASVPIRLEEVITNEVTLELSSYCSGIAITQ